MGIITPIYIRIEKFSFSKQENGKFRADFDFSVYTDQNKSTKISSNSSHVIDIEEANMNLPFLYEVLKNSGFKDVKDEI